MNEDEASRENSQSFFQIDLSSPASHIAHYPPSIFATLVWLKREQEALALAALIEKSATHAEMLCTIAKHLRMRGDGEKQQILSVLAQAQECLASLEKQEEISHIQQDLVEELIWWQQWLPAQQVADSTNDFWGREWTFGPIFEQRLQTGMWKEALAAAHSAGESGHRWMFCDLCDALAKAHIWDDAEEVARLINHPGSKVTALSALARELAAASYAERAQSFWQQAIQTAFEEGVTIWVFGDLSEELARSHQWELAEAVARALTFPLPGAEARAKQAEARAKQHVRGLDQQSYDRIDALWIPVERSKALAILAREYTLAQHWADAKERWEEARVLAYSCKSTWHQTVALGNLTLCFAEADLWEPALATWRQAEGVWKEAQARRTREAYLEEEGVGSFQAYDYEEEERRLKVLIPLSRHLVKAQQWKQAWRLFCELEEASMKIKVGRVIATTLDQLQQNEDAQMVWKHISEVALTAQLYTNDLAKLALALQQAQCWEEAGAVWKASVNSILEADQDTFDHNAINSGSLALSLAQAQRWEEAELVLKESRKAAALSADADFQQAD